MKDHLHGEPARWCVAIGVTTWVGVMLGVHAPSIVVASLVPLAVAGVMVWRPAIVLVAFCILGVASGWMTVNRTAAMEAVELPEGPVSVVLRVAEDAARSTYGQSVAEVLSVDGEPQGQPRVAVRNLPTGVTVGGIVAANGVMRDGSRRIRDEVVAGTFTIKEVTSTQRSGNPIVHGGNAIRAAVASRYDGDHVGDGLLSGFLTGDTDRMLASHEEDLRRAGLSHFVAVSGSNVAMFLGIWWIVTAPLSIHPRIRVVIGALGLMLFAVVTRWEPSVIRASVMASVPLVGGLVGIPVDPWMALGVAVTVLLLLSGHLAMSVGFQLSVLATAGVLVGLTFAKGRTPRWLVVPLMATMGAQLAVAPLLLGVFGTVPLLSPVTNLVASPVIGFTTVVAAVGVVLEPAAEIARLGASLVLWIAQLTAGGPQLGVAGSVAALCIGIGLMKATLRPLIASVGLILVLVAAPWVHPWPSVPTLVALDVGQGDAVLIQDPSGASLLMDGGSDPRVLDAALRRHGVRTLDTVVVSHSDLDHSGGLTELIAEGRIRTLVVSAFVSDTDLVDAAEHAGVRVDHVRTGDRITVGSVLIEVLSPNRRFATDNDGSVVLFLHGDTTVLLPGDIERIGQHTLPSIHPDVMVVPHHGSATTDLNWLEDTVGPTAILSYGPNTYGHPHPTITALLDALGVQVLRTETGDVTIPLISTP